MIAIPKQGQLHVALIFALQKAFYLDLIVIRLN